MNDGIATMETNTQKYRGMNGPHPLPKFKTKLFGLYIICGDRVKRKKKHTLTPTTGTVLKIVGIVKTESTDMKMKCTQSPNITDISSDSLVVSSSHSLCYLRSWNRLATKCFKIHVWNDKSVSH